MRYKIHTRSALLNVIYNTPFKVMLNTMYNAWYYFVYSLQFLKIEKCVTQISKRFNYVAQFFFFFT